MAKIAKAWGKLVATVKGAARSTKKSVVRTVDVAKQKNAIAHKQNALREMYEEIGKYICACCQDGTLRLNGSGIAGSIACKDQIAEFLILESEFKDEIERMEKMLYWLQTHEVKVNTSPVTEEAHAQETTEAPETFETPEAPAAEQTEDAAQAAAEEKPEAQPEAESAENP